MTGIWTHGVWTVKPGHEANFVAAWRAMARDALQRIRELTDEVEVLTLDDVPLDG
jgi:hypothetical protein